MYKGRVMVVEDDADLAQILKYNLHMRGYQCLEAGDGIAACELIEYEMPDLVLLDILLPRMDGWQVCKFIRNHPEEIVSESPIIMLTALASATEKLKGIELGADDYIPKPFSVREVMLRIDRLIGREGKKKTLKAEIERLQEKENQRTDFQNMLFHELKNQLTVIGGFSKRMVENSSLTPENYQHCAGVINEYSVSMNTLSEEILLLLRLDLGEIPLPSEAVSVEEILEQIISQLGKQAQEKQIAIQFERSAPIPLLQLNATAIKLAIGNLVQNAIKYSPNDSVITVRAGFDAHKGALIQVLDNGPGIPEKDEQNIFDRFYRGENVKGCTKGMGLGLYISKTLLSLMGGTISLESSEKMGACFNIALPTMTSSTMP